MCTYAYAWIEHVHVHVRACACYNDHTCTCARAYTFIQIQFELQTLQLTFNLNLISSISRSYVRVSRNCNSTRSALKKEKNINMRVWSREELTMKQSEWVSASKGEKQTKQTKKQRHENEPWKKTKDCPRTREMEIDCTRCSRDNQHMNNRSAQPVHEPGRQRKNRRAYHTNSRRWTTD